MKSDYEILGVPNEPDFSMEVPDEPLAKHMFQQIEMLKQQEAYEKAVAAAKEAIRCCGEQEIFLFELADNQLRAGHSGNAVKSFERLVEKYPENNSHKKHLAMTYYVRGFRKKAFQAFETAYDAGVRDTDFILEYSLCCGDLEENERGLAILLEMVKAYDNTAEEQLEDYLEAFTGIFTLDFYEEGVNYGEYLKLYLGFLETAGRLLVEYEETMLDNTCFFTSILSSLEYLPELNEMLEKTKKLFPEKEYAEDWEGISDTLLNARLHLDERLDQEICDCFEVYIEACDIYSDSVVHFIQLDCNLLLLERIEYFKPQLDIVKKEYPKLYERMKDFYEMLEKGDIAHAKDKMLKEYDRLEKNFEGGHYYERYPQNRQEEGKVQWNSMEDGAFVRPDRKVGRNDPCPCGSGKKYKNCCGK